MSKRHIERSDASGQLEDSESGGKKKGNLVNFWHGLDYSLVSDLTNKNQGDILVVVDITTLETLKF